MTEPIIIKVNDLQRESKNITNHISELVQARDILFRRKNFSMCIGTSVLIIEEIAKLHLIAQHIKSKKPIRKTEWESMYRHKQKLTKPFIGLSRKMKKLPLDAMEKSANTVRPNLGTQLVEILRLIGDMEPDVLKSSRLFDKLKQDCFYVSQRHGQLFSISNNLISKEQAKLAFWIKEHSQTLFLGTMLYFDNNNLQNFQKHIEKLANKSYLKRHQSGHSVFEKYYWKD